MDTQPQTIGVVHYSMAWLPQSMTWLHMQVKSLPEEVENYIVCDRTENLDQFGLPNIFSLQELPAMRRRLRSLQIKFRVSPPYSLHVPLLEDVIRRSHPNLVHSHFGHMGWVNGPVARKHGLKHVVSFYGADVNYVPTVEPEWRARYRQLNDRADKVLCEGPFMAESIAKLGVAPEKIEVHRLGVEVEKIKFQPRRREKGRKLRFLIVGAFREKKGIPYALAGLGHFKKVHEDFEITVIGDAAPRAHEKPEKEVILSTAKEWGLQSRIRFLGFQPHSVVFEEAYKHDIFISPSVTAEDGDCEGGAPITIIELAASGMPVISTRHCDIPFVLSPENGALLAEERDSEGLCRNILKLMDSDWDAITQANRHFIERNLNARVQGENLSGIYHRVLGRNYAEVPGGARETYPRDHEAIALKC